MLIDFAFRTTLFRLRELSGVPVHVLNELPPFVKPVTLPDLGIATPSVSDKSIPSDVVSLLQNTPKSRPSPSRPTVESAFFALSTFAKYAYQFPSVA